MRGSQWILNTDQNYTTSTSDGGLRILDIRRRDGGRENEVVLHVGGNAVAANVLGDLNPLGDCPCRSLADNGARVPKVLPTVTVTSRYSIKQRTNSNKQYFAHGVT